MVSPSAKFASFAFGRGFAAEIGFDLLQRGNAVAPEVALAGLGKQWLGHKAVLDA